MAVPFAATAVGAVLLGMLGSLIANLLTGAKVATRKTSSGGLRIGAEGDDRRVALVQEAQAQWHALRAEAAWVRMSPAACAAVRALARRAAALHVGCPPLTHCTAPPARDGRALAAFALCVRRVRRLLVARPATRPAGRSDDGRDVSTGIGWTALPQGGYEIHRPRRTT